VVLAPAIHFTDAINSECACETRYGAATPALQYAVDIEGRYLSCVSTAERRQ
jgi:hypothetical protein